MNAWDRQCSCPQTKIEVTSRRQITKVMYVTYKVGVVKWLKQWTFPIKTGVVFKQCHITKLLYVN